MPTNPATLERQAPQRWPRVGTPTATGPLTEADFASNVARWPMESDPLMIDSVCNGNCRVGRACDCVADVDFADKPPMSKRDGWALVALAVGCVAIWAFALGVGL